MLKHKKVLKTLLFTIILTICFGSLLIISTITSKNKAVAAEDIVTVTNNYKINAYDVKINVNENNVYNITETIQADFSVRKHGLIRYIPLVYDINYPSGATRTKSKISNIIVKRDGEYEKFSQTTDTGCTLKIGKADIYLTGEHTYSISYDYDFGMDRAKGCDMFYFNIIGDMWDTSISNVSFSVTMPKSFDSSSENLKIYWGKYLEKNTEDLTFEVNGNVVSGSLNRTLNPKEGLSVELNLPQGYFSSTADYFFNVGMTICLVLGIIAIVVSLILLIVARKRNKTVVPITFFAPKGYNSLDLAIEYKGYKTNKDVISLIIYLASKGYLSIKQDGQDFTLTKIKDYDGKNSSEKYLFDKLFKKDRKSVTTADLKKEYFGEAMSAVPCKIVEGAAFDKRGTIIRWIQFAMYSIVLFGLLLISVLDNSFDLNVEIFICIGTSVCIATFGYFVPYVLITLRRKYNITPLLLWLAIVAVSYSIMLTIFKIAFFDGRYAAIVLVSGLCQAGCAISMIFTTIRKEDHKKIYGEILGFKNFLNRARKPEIEKLVEENPMYFFDVLPYAYVLGVSKKWIKKFETIDRRYTDSMSEIGPFDYIFMASFSRNMSSFMNSTSSAARSFHHDSSSSGGFGGSFGGGVGGGAGGGGGSSW